MQEESKGAEVDWDCQKVVKGIGHGGKHPKTEENQHNVETNMQCQDRGPGGHRGKEVELGDVEGEFGGVGGEWERQSDGNGVVYEGDRFQMDGTTSGARCDSI